MGLLKLGTSTEIYDLPSDEMTRLHKQLPQIFSLAADKSSRFRLRGPIARKQLQLCMM